MRDAKLPFALLAAISIVTGGAIFSAQGQDGPPAQGRTEGDLPTERGVVIDVDAPDAALYKIAIPEFIGQGGGEAANVVRGDLRLVSLFEVVNQRSHIDPEASSLTISDGAWTAIGAQGVAKAQITRNGDQVQVRAIFRDIARGQNLERNYSGRPAEVRRFMHDFANRILYMLTGRLGAFGSRLTFARRTGPGRKDVFVGDFDGHRVGRVSSGEGISMLPSFGPGGVWFTRLTNLGTYITHHRTDDRPIISGDGLNMAPAFCGGRIFFSSTRDGNSEIYSANRDGSDIRRLTNNPSIDVSPTCGPGGRILFVSGRHGGAQVFSMSRGGGGVRRITFRGENNQTPAACLDPDTPLVAFTGNSGGSMDIFTVNITTGEYTRLTQGQGTNKDPAFSPDCRMVAFYSSRSAGPGIYVSNPEGLNQNRVIPGHAETIRWSRSATDLGEQ